MLIEPNDLEKFFEEVLRKHMADILVSKVIQVSTTRVLWDSPSTGCCSTRINLGTEQRRKHHCDLANMKQIPPILPEYILPLAGVVNRDSIPHDFEYSMFTVYILKGIRIVGSHLGKISLLNHSEFNLGDQKNYAMLAPRCYLMRTTRKKPHLILQPWIKDLV
jgi:hypothetical protein